MSTIRCIYEKAPNFPATDQHPDAVRYTVGPHVVDAIGGEPTLDEIEAVLNPPSAQVSKIESETGMTRWQRDVVKAVLPTTHPQRIKAEKAETDIAAIGVRAKGSL